MKKPYLTLVCSMMIVSLAVFASAQAPAAKPAKKPARQQAPKKPRTAEGAVTPEVKNPERHEQFLKRIKQGPADLLFLGDSITDGWRGQASFAKFAPYNPADFGISGDRTEHVLWRITHGELEGIKPKVVVIMIGTNNVGHFGDEKPEWAAAGVKKIIDTVQEKLPEAKILLLAVFPRDKHDSSMRKRVDGINEIIAKFGDGKKVRFLDINKVFLDANGDIPKDIMPDSLHPNVKGYGLWYDAMQPMLSEMMGK